MKKINNFLDKVKDWGDSEENILAIALVGSYARNAAKEDSDVDLMIITKEPELFIYENFWISKFGQIKEVKDEVWGQLKTKRVFFKQSLPSEDGKNGLEVEFNFDKKSWANSEDSGTRRVITDGMKILVDKENILYNLINDFESYTKF